MVLTETAEICAFCNLARPLQYRLHEPNGFSDPTMRTSSMTVFTQRIFAAASALALSLALMAGTVTTPSNIATLATQQEMI